MKILSKGIYRNGKIELREKIPIEEGKEVIVFLPTEEKNQIDLSLLLAQQESLKKIWLDDENLYGKYILNLEIIKQSDKKNGQEVENANHL